MDWPTTKDRQILQGGPSEGEEYSAVVFHVLYGLEKYYIIHWK